MSLLLVGLDNPQSGDPRYALYPQPAGCTGHRLWKMMNEADANFTPGMYHQRIAKTNLFPVGPAPKRMSVFHAYAGNVLRVQLQDSGTRVVLLGNAVRDSVLFDVSMDRMLPVMKFREVQDCQYAWIPHPSRRNHFYNDPKKRRAVGRWLLEAHRGK